MSGFVAKRGMPPLTIFVEEFLTKELLKTEALDDVFKN